MQTATTLDLSALLLDTLGYTPDEFVSIGHDGDGEFSTAVTAATDAATHVATLPGRANIFFGVNPVAGPARQCDGRGTAADVTRLAALVADLDVEPNKCETIEVAHQIIDDLSGMLGSRPSAITHSGHGLHPYWPVSDGETLSNTEAAAVSRRWGRLVGVVAETHRARVDTVFDLTRMLRAPGTINCKAKTNGHKGIDAVTYADTGGPLTVAEIDERLNEYGVYEEDDDTRSTEQISNPADWAFADDTCNYVTKLIDDIPSDGPLPGKGRHQWVLKQAVRLACALMLGCISETEWRRAQKLLDERLRQLRAATSEKVPRFEVPAAMRFGIERASAKTEDQARVELGDHEHATDNVTHSAHLGMAIKLGEVFKDKLVYVNKVGWHRWDGKRFAPDDDGAARRAVHTMLRREWIKCAELDADEKTKRAKQITRYETASAITGILTEAAALQEFSVTVDDLDADPYLLNVANGALDLHTLEIRPHRPADRITKLCRGAYTPDVAAPVWEAFLTKVLPDEEVRAFVGRLAGLALLGCVREHILPIFTGTGRNGKSTLYEALLHTLGDYACTAEPDLFMHRENAHPTGQMDLLGKRLVVVSENDENRRFAESTMKRLTGGDRIKARYMHKDFVEFTPSHLPILVTNHLPKVSGDDLAIWERVFVVPFDVFIPKPKRDTELGEKLTLEADGILTWCVTGLRDYLANGLAEPASVRVATDNYQKNSDAAGRFIDEECHRADAVKITAGELFDAWEAWRKVDGAAEISRKAFGQALGRLGFTSKDSNGKRWWLGICILKSSRSSFVGEEQ